MNANPYLKPSDDPVIELAASHFLAHAAQRGEPRRRGMSLRIGNLVMVFGVPLTVAYYEVFKYQSGEEGIGLLDHPSEDVIARLSGD